MTIAELRRRLDFEQRRHDATADTAVVVMMTSDYVLLDSVPYHPFMIGDSGSGKVDGQECVLLFCNQPAE